MVTIVDRPSRWPRWLRRTAILTFPISLPLWFIVSLLTDMSISIASVAGDLTTCVRRLWRAA